MSTKSPIASSRHFNVDKVERCDRRTLIIRIRRLRKDSIPVNFDRIKRTPEDKANGADTSYGPTEQPQGIEELRLVI
jgi:hypothetical protein